MRTKRAYEPTEPGDGYRILVERPWPRGVTKDAAHLDEWKDLAPSPDLRRWFGHDPERFPEFRRRYLRELRAREGELEALRRRARRGPVTLVYGARDTEHNGAVVLAELLREGRPRAASPAARRSRAFRRD